MWLNHSMESFYCFILPGSGAFCYCSGVPLMHIMYLSVTYDFSHTTNYLWCALIFMVIKIFIMIFFI